MFMNVKLFTLFSEDNKDEKKEIKQETEVKDEKNNEEKRYCFSFLHILFCMLAQNAVVGCHNTVNCIRIPIKMQR